jgi:hypothetical protein
LAVEQGPVLFISEDSPDSVIQEYIETLCDLYDIQWDGLPFYINEQHGLRIETMTISEGERGVRVVPARAVYVIIDSCESLVPSERSRSKSSTRSASSSAGYLTEDRPSRSSTTPGKTPKERGDEPAGKAVRVDRQG